MFCKPENLYLEEFQDWDRCILCYSDTYWTMGVSQCSSMGQRPSKSKSCLQTKKDKEKSEFCQAGYDIQAYTKQRATQKRHNDSSIAHTPSSSVRWNVREHRAGTDIRSTVELLSNDFKALQNQSPCAQNVCIFKTSSREHSHIWQYLVHNSCAKDDFCPIGTMLGPESSKVLCQCLPPAPPLVAALFLLLSSMPRFGALSPGL